MIKKRLSKTLWYGSDVDKEGKPILPPLAKDANDLEGIHEGELYLHLEDGSALLFTRSADGQVVQLGSNADELANYLLKSVWDKAFEIRTTETGEEYLFGKLNFATQYGITMYANGGLLDLPNIFEGIPFDNKTIWLNPDTKLVEVIGSTEEDEGSADFSNVKTSGEGNAFTSFILSEDGKELTFVKGETFAKQSDYEALNTKVTDFLEGSDTDNIINKWKELEAFLSGMKESDDLATILTTKWTKDDAKIANWDAAFGWGDHSKAGYMKKSVIYDESLKCWKLDGDLLVTGGITMYANEGKYTPSTITQGVNVDGVTIINDGTKLMLNPNLELGGGVTDYNDLDNLPDLNVYATKGTTLAHYGITDAYTRDDIDGLLDDYLPLTGGTIAGDLRLRKGSEYTSPYLYFGDSDEVWMKEATDTHLTIHADGSVNIDSPKTIIDGIEIKKLASGALFIDANVVVSGGVSMYGTDGTTANTIWDDAPIASTTRKGIASFDSNYFAVNNGKVTFIGEVGGGGIESITKQMVLDALGYTPYDANNPNGYVTSAGSVAYATTSGTCSGNAATATKATQDGNGNNIANTYLAKTTASTTYLGINAKAASATSADSATNATNASKVYLTGSSSNSTYRLVFADGASGSNRSLYVDNENTATAGYNPSTNTFVGNGVTLSNGVYASIKTKGWYRFATTINAENVAGGSLIFSIRRQYNNYKTESHIIAVSVGYSSVTFTQIAGAPSDALITKVRATNNTNGVIYFDFYYGVDTTNTHNVYVNCIGSASLKTPTSTTQLLSYVTEFDLANGFKSNAIHFTSLNNLGYLRSKCGKNLLVGGDNLSGGTAYAFARYSYSDAVQVNRTYRLTICGKLGENTSHIYAYWDGGSGNNTYIGGLSQTEERIITVRAKITNKGSGNQLVFYKFNSSNTQETTSYSYIRWAYLEEEFQEGELGTSDYNTWLTEYNKRDTKTFLHKIQRLNVGESYWSADAGMKIDNENAYAVVMKRTKDNGGTFIRMFANNQNTQSWASGVNNAHQFSWWYQNETSDVQKMKLDNTGSLSSDYWKISNLSTNPYLMLTQGSTWYIQGYEGYLYLGAGSAKSMRIDSSGNVLVVGGITMYSDLRKKTILNHVELSLKDIANAPLIEHYYNSDEKKTTHVGSIAQYWYGLNDWFCKKDEEGFLTMEIQNAALASAISVARELTRYESKTDKQIKKLKKRIGELEEEIENLKKV